MTQVFFNNILPRLSKRGKGGGGGACLLPEIRPLATNFFSNFLLQGSTCAAVHSQSGVSDLPLKFPRRSIITQNNVLPLNYKPSNFCTKNLFGDFLPPRLQRSQCGVSDLPLKFPRQSIITQNNVLPFNYKPSNFLYYKPLQ